MSGCKTPLPVALLFTFALVAPEAQSPSPKVPVSRERLCVTEGALAARDGNRLGVDVPRMRAYVNGWTSQEAALGFTYLGPTDDQVPLESGEVRQQFGLKLLAENACNLVYVMWRLLPESRIVVSLKKNPGQTRSSECGNRGYQNIKPARSKPVAAVAPGDAHELDANLNGTQLTVMVDGAEVWAGDVGHNAELLHGPIGIRSDNARLTFDLQAAPAPGPHPQFLRACQSGPEVSD